MLALAVMIHFYREKTRGLYRYSRPVNVSELYYTKNLNFMLVTLDANMSETSFCQNLLVDMVIIPGKKNTHTSSVGICLLSSANVM